MSETLNYLHAEITDIVKLTGIYAKNILLPNNGIEFFGTAGVIAGIATAVKERKVLMPALLIAGGAMWANHQAGSRTHLYEVQDSV